MEERYPSDLKDAEWEMLKDYFKRSDPRGRRNKYDKRDLVNAILYINKAGCQWRMLPKEFPKWQAVYDNFRRWNQRGIWEKVLNKLNRDYRKKKGG